MRSEEPGSEPSGVARFIVDSVEISETDKDVVIIGDLPPYEKVDLLTASVNGEGLRMFALLDQGSGASPKFRACTFGAFARLFRLRENGANEPLEAHVEDGLLRVLIPKNRL